MNQMKIKVSTYDEVYESCSICGRDMHRTKDIWVDINNDVYICKYCKDKFNISAVLCAELD